MNNVVSQQGRILAPSEDGMRKVIALEQAIFDSPQEEIATHHVLHGGLYARTILLPAGQVVAGAFICVPTLLVLDGHASFNAGDGQAITLKGHHVLAASAGRRQVFVAIEDTSLTMVFATQASTVEQAEDEFTNEAHLLVSRKPGAVNHFNITGE